MRRRREGEYRRSRTQTVASQPIPNAPVAIYKATMPGTAGARLGMPNSSALFARPPNSARRQKQTVSAMLPFTMILLLPTASMSNQLNVIRKK